jgi:hypothetical protein
VSRLPDATLVAAESGLAATPVNPRARRRRSEERRERSAFERTPAGDTFGGPDHGHTLARKASARDSANARRATALRGFLHAILSVRQQFSNRCVGELVIRDMNSEQIRQPANAPKWKLR